MKLNEILPGREYALGGDETRGGFPVVANIRRVQVIALERLAGVRHRLALVENLDEQGPQSPRILGRDYLHAGRGERQHVPASWLLCEWERLDDVREAHFSDQIRAKQAHELAIERAQKLRASFDGRAEVELLSVEPFTTRVTVSTTDEQSIAELRDLIRRERERLHRRLDESFRIGR